MLKMIDRTSALIAILALLSLLLAGCALFNSVAINPPPPPQTQLPGHNLISTGPPVLSCKASTLLVGAPNVEGWGLQCTLVQAPQSDTHFTVHLLLVNAQGNADHFFADVCGDVLRYDQGDCRANFFTPPGLTGEKVELFAVSLPSKQLSNPVRPLASGASR
jgi:hypothetical protein